MKLISPDAIDASPIPGQEPEQDFESVLLSRTPTSDGELADLIEQDGRWRLNRGLPCGLDRYRQAIPDLRTRPIALDAAIDISLRSLARIDGCDQPLDRHADSLLKSYPELAGPIRLAALLGHQLVSTIGLPSPGPRRTRLALPRWIGPELENGTRRYELTRALGRGSSGTVCEAVDHLLSDPTHAARVAVKLIPVQAATFQRQAAEATKARRIDHPGVVRVLDRGLTDSDELYLVYELVTGGDLQAWFEARDKKLDLRTAAAIVAAIARGVQAAHDAGLVHCDLKPSNVLMTPDGQPRVSDFGVAVAASDAHLPAPGDPAGKLPVGNLAFAAPEQIRQSSSSASPPVDIYAIGGLLYFLTASVLPNGSSAEEVLRTHDPARGRRVAPSIRASRPECDPRLDRICARALSPRPEARYSSAGEIAADLQAWLDRRPIGWMRESTPRRVALWARRSPVLATLAASCLVLGIGGSYYAYRSAQLESARSDARTAALEKFKELRRLKQMGGTMTEEQAIQMIHEFDPAAQVKPTALEGPSGPKRESLAPPTRR